MFAKLAATGVAFATLALAGAAQAAECGPRDQIVERLAQKYGETRRSIGLDAGNQVVEMFAADATGTWTITVTKPNGRTCLIASGQAFEAMADALPRPGDDA